jgi:hypothetical protein
MAEPLYRQLVSQAAHLARLDPTKPKQANLRRAISSAYYALFHFLVHRSSRFLIGNVRERKPLRHALARAYDHGEMASAAKSFYGGTLPAPIQWHVGKLMVTAELKQMAGLFLEAQEQRHLADYDLTAVFRREEAIALIERVRQVFEDWDAIADDPATHFFLVCLLIWNRLKSR